MNSPCAINFYHGTDSYYTMMVHRPTDSGEEYGNAAQCEFCRLTKEEAWLVAKWAEKVLDDKAHRYTDISPWGWTIFLPARVVETRRLLSPMQRLVGAIGRHPAAEDDPDVIDAINALGAVLEGEPT